MKWASTTWVRNISDVPRDVYLAAALSRTPKNTKECSTQSPPGICKKKLLPARRTTTHGPDYCHFLVGRLFAEWSEWVARTPLIRGRFCRGDSLPLGPAAAFFSSTDMRPAVSSRDWVFSTARGQAQFTSWTASLKYRHGARVRCAERGMTDSTCPSHQPVPAGRRALVPRTRCWQAKKLTPVFNSLNNSSKKSAFFAESRVS